MLPPPDRSPVGPKRRQVPELRIRWKRSLAIVSARRPAVLIRNRAPTEIGERPIGNEADSFKWIDRRVADRAQMGPIVPEVEDIDELLSRPEPCKPHDAAVLD